MIKDKLIALALTSAIAFAPMSYALAKETAANDASMQTVARDFTKLSNDGFTAFRNIHLARLALFDGKPGQAKSFVSHAHNALKKAKTDETAFSKAMADITPPKAGKDRAKTAEAGASGKDQLIQWLPIDAEMALTEDYSVTPKNNEAAKKANSQLKQGDRKGAIETLNFAGIDLEYTIVLMPIARTESILKSTIKGHQQRQILPGQSRSQEDRGQHGDRCRQCRAAAAAPPAKAQQQHQKADASDMKPGHSPEPSTGDQSADGATESQNQSQSN